MTLLRGLPGSGKSTKAAGMAAMGATVLTTDDFFTGQDGVYRCVALGLVAAPPECCCLRCLAVFVLRCNLQATANTGCSQNIASSIPLYAFCLSWDQSKIGEAHAVRTRCCRCGIFIRVFQTVFVDRIATLCVLPTVLLIACWLTQRIAG